MSSELAVGGHGARVSLANAEPGGAELAGVPHSAFERLKRVASRGASGSLLVAVGLSPQSSREFAWRLERARVELLFAPRLIDVAGHASLCTLLRGSI